MLVQKKRAEKDDESFNVVRLIKKRIKRIPGRRKMHPGGWL